MPSVPPPPPSSPDPHPPAVRAQVLLVEDAPDHADVLADALRKPGHVSTLTHTVDAALEELTHGAFDVIVTDLRMPTSAGQHGTAADGADAGLRVLAAAKRLQPGAETIMVTAHGDVATARSAFKEGVYDFIEKPLDLEVFRNLVHRAAETSLLRTQNTQLRVDAELRDFGNMVAVSSPMRSVLDRVRAVSPSDIPVLITGESGSGKELIARATHDLSRRSRARFVAFNCAGQSESLIEDQLFGHAKGAFTGAEKDREGVFEYASGGTLFLDEIGDMPPTMQAKLLRALESGEIVRLGSNEPRKTDVRFVSATNRDLRSMVAEGTFREDLYFRINGAHVHLPALRDRREDIPPLLRRAVRESWDRLAKGTVPSPACPDVSDAALSALVSCAWPGNVRQLLNAAQQMTVLAIGAGEVTIDTRHLPPDLLAEAQHAGAEPPGANDGSLAGVSLDLLEKRAIRETLRMASGNREHAANLLGIGERTLYRKLKEYGLR